MQLYAQQFNVEQTKFTVDSVKDTVSTVQALSAASKEMKSQFKKNKELDISYIDKMQDDMFDMMVRHMHTHTHAHTQHCRAHACFALFTRGSAGKHHVYNCWR